MRWRHAPWWRKNVLLCAALDQSIAPEYRHFEKTHVGGAMLYTGTIEVPETGAVRRLTLIFNRTPNRWDPIVVADGPRRSRHRYTWLRPTALCMWYPRDPAAMRWRLSEEGLTGLIDRARVHLLRESWFRATGSWPAPEIHKEPNPRSKNDGGYRQLRVKRQRCWCGRGRYAQCHGAVDASQELSELQLVEPVEQDGAA